MNVARPSGGEPSLKRTSARTVDEARRVRSRTERTPDGIEYMHALPDEIVSSIMSSLPHADLASCYSVDRRFRNIASDLVRSANVKPVEMLTHLMFAFRRLEKLGLSIAETTRQEEVFSAFLRHALFNKPRMRELTIAGAPGSELSARSMERLTYASTLISLDLMFIRAGAGAMQQLQHLPNLRTLSLRIVELDDSKLDFLAHTPGLQDLTLIRCIIDDRDLSRLRCVSKLRRLALDSSDINDSGLAHVKELSRLEALQLDSSNVEGDGFANLTCAGELKSLTWTNREQSNMALQHIAKFNSLETLEFGRGVLDDPDNRNRIGLAPLRNMANLKHLELVGMIDVLDADLVHVASLPNVKQIDLWGSEGFTRAGIETLLAMPSLRKLELTDSNFEGLTADLRGKYPHCTIVDESD